MQIVLKIAIDILMSIDERNLKEVEYYKRNININDDHDDNNDNNDNLTMHSMLLLYYSLHSFKYWSHWKFKLFVEQKVWAQVLSTFIKLVNMLESVNIDINSHQRSLFHHTTYDCEKILLVLNSLVANSDKYKQHIVDIGLIQQIGTILKHIFRNQQHYDNSKNKWLEKRKDPTKAMVTKMVAVANNVSLGTVVHTQSLIDNDILKLTIDMLKMNEVNMKTRHEAVMTLSNAMRVIELPTKTNILTWNIERQIWIAHFNNEKCLFSELPKDIVLFVLSFFNSKFDSIYTKQQIDRQEKRYSQIEYLVKNGILDVWVNKVLLVNDKYHQHVPSWMQESLKALKCIFKCGKYLQEKNNLETNEHTLMFTQIGGLDKV